jgi:hypothetical protein
MKKTVSALIAAVILVSAVVGCASIFTGGSQDVAVNTVPSEARVKVYNRANALVVDGTTPVTLDLKKNAGYFKSEKYRIEIAKQGYRTQTVTLTGSANGWYIVGNFFVGGLIGWLIVDPLTGGMWTLKPKEVNAELGSAAQGDSVTTLHIALRENLDASVLTQYDLIRLN